VFKVGFTNLLFNVSFNVMFNVSLKVGFLHLLHQNLLLMCPLMSCLMCH
jgi:hypothetical protein